MTHAFSYKKHQTKCLSNKGISPNGNVSGDVVFHVRHGV